jgi:hypothetical protein
MRASFMLLLAITQFDASPAQKYAHGYDQGAIAD